MRCYTTKKGGDHMNQAERNKNWMKYLPFVALTVLGAVGGYCYYRFVGCVSGICAITSNPWISTIYGGIIGALLGSVFAPKKQKLDQKEQNSESSDRQHG